jgi:hypothetical protein
VLATILGGEVRRRPKGRRLRRNAHVTVVAWFKAMREPKMHGGEIQPLLDLTPVAEIAALLAKGYLRLLARKVAPAAANKPQAPSETAPTGLDDVGERSVHGDG